MMDDTVVSWQCFISFVPSAPSGPPTAVTAAPVGNNQLQVQWVPPGNVSGYLILYRSNASGVEYSEIVSDPDAMGHVIRNVPVDQLNVRYTGTILAFAELLGERSEEFTVILSGKALGIVWSAVGR